MFAPIEFFVPGIPRPAGSKRAFPIHRKNGKLGVSVSDMSGEKGKTWRNDIIGFATHSMIGKIPSLDDALRLEVIFVMPRPKNHYGRRGLKPKAPFWHNCRPDCGKLVRALEDALTGTIWKDDAQVVQVIASKIYGEICGAHIWIKTIHSPDKAVTKSLPVPLSPDSPDRSRA